MSVSIYWQGSFLSSHVSMANPELQAVGGMINLLFALSTANHLTVSRLGILENGGNF